MSGPRHRPSGRNPRLTCPRCGNRRVLYAYERRDTNPTRGARFAAACKYCLDELGELGATE